MLVYIYIYFSLSLSLYIYIYIHMFLVLGSRTCSLVVRRHSPDPPSVSAIITAARRARLAIASLSPLEHLVHVLRFEHRDHVVLFVNISLGSNKMNDTSEDQAA